jgi:hypothetical protein
MIRPMELVLFVLGLVCLALIFWDVFETVVVPRPTPGRLRVSRRLLVPTWRAWRAVALRTTDGLSRDRLLGFFAPASVVILLFAWLLILVVGYGLILFALRDELRPVPGDLGSALYFAGSSVLTLGYGDLVATGPLARVAVLTAAAAGLGVVALVITFLFSLFGSYQRREVLVVALQARAKAPPSAVTLLENYVRLDLVRELPVLFAEWERWSAEVLDSHVAYPLLGYFRSSHDNLSWISALGAVLDAACLLLTTVRGVPRGQAELMKRVGAHLVEDISNYMGFRDGDGSIVERADFEEAYARLGAAGYKLEDPDRAWRAFQAGRALYAARLDFLADYWATPATLWLGERVPVASPAHRGEQKRTHEAG